MLTKKVKVIKPFGYSLNGIDILDAVEGAEIDCPLDAIEGLTQEGFINEIIETKPIEEVTTKEKPSLKKTKREKN